MRHPLPWFLLSDEARRCIHGTTIDCLGCRSSLLEYRFGRSGSSGFVVSIRRLRLSSRGLAPRGRCCRDRCRYRYIYRPKRIRFPLRGRLKIRNYLRALHLFFAKKIFSSVFLNETISVSIFISISICFSIFKDF